MSVSTDQTLARLYAERDLIIKTRMDLDGAAAGRAFTDAERKQHEDISARSAEIDTSIAAVRARATRYDANAAVLAPIVGAENPAAGNTLGEQLLVRGQAALGALGVAKYAGASDTLTRALQHGVAADGTSPVTIEGDLVKFVDANRYAVHASRRIPMPDNHAPTFKRPRATQLTQVGTQAAEGDVLASRRLQLTGDTVTKVTKGGTLALSEQEIDWTDPAMLGLAVEDLAEQYAVEADDFLCIAIEAKVTTNNTPTPVDVSAPDFIANLATAAAAVYSTAKKLPDVLYAGTNRWAALLALTDGDGRPLFPNIGAQNAPGSVQGAGTFSGNVQGLQLVVDPNFDADFLAVGVSQLVEFYEQNKGLLSVNAPSTLEVLYAYRGYVASNVYAAGLQGLKAA